MSDVNELQDALSAPAPTQRQIIETWLALQEAQKAAEQAARAAEQQSRAAHKAEQSRIKLVEAGFQEIERLRALEPQISQGIQNYHSLATAVLGIDEKLEDLHARQGVIDEKVKLILEIERAQMSNIRDPQVRKELEGRIDEAQGLSLDAASVKRRLARQVNNLNYLEEQAASYGAGRAPVGLINQITDTVDLIQNLEKEFRAASE